MYRRQAGIMKHKELALYVGLALNGEYIRYGIEGLVTEMDLWLLYKKDQGVFAHEEQKQAQREDQGREL